MEIYEMFKKPIDRDIKGVIKVGQTGEAYQELSEYVVTSELLKHFREFFSSYNKSLNISTDDIGVWISGFFGSGKSHFLKILSYILNSKMEVSDVDNNDIKRRPIDFFKEDGKIDDPIVLADMESSTDVSTDVILFNIDSKSSAASSENTKILEVFVAVFNDYRGYCSGYPFIAEFEKNLDKNGKYEEFKTTFEEIEGTSWVESRDDFYFVSDSVIESLVKINYMSKDAAKNWVDKAEENYNMTIEKFAEEVNEYCKNKGNNHHVLFLVDEVGQYIGDSTPLMLNLQSLTEDLGVKCKGNAWIIVTSQQNIDDIISVKGQDFSKIQGRFKTRLSLSSANVDEVIHKRILEKTDGEPHLLKGDKRRVTNAQKELEEYYATAEAVIKNLITFKESAEMKTYNSTEEFVSIYPFIPYQFNLLQAVLTSIREHGASGKHLAEGERSMLALFQESAIKLKNKEIGALVPFDIFYDALEKFIDHSHSSVIIKAYNNDRLNDFDVRVLKTLFLIKYVKELPSNVENIATLMVSNVNDDKIDLKNKIEKSLRKLLTETLIQKNGEIYSFLTNEEQDLNREIKNETVEIGEILDDVYNHIFYRVISDKKYKYSSRYNFSFNKIIDERLNGKQTSDIGIRIITPFYESEIDDGQIDLDGNIAKNNMEHYLKELSKTKNEVIFYLGNDLTVFDEIREILQIRKYLQKNNSTIKADLKNVKHAELSDKVERSELFLEEALKYAQIYINGQKIDIVEKNPSERVNEAMDELVKHVFSKLDYFKDFAPDKNDILNEIRGQTQQTLYDTPAKNAVNDLFNYIDLKSNMHEKVTLKDIINRFSSAPYGYTDLDIGWMVANLFNDNSISLIKNSETISLGSFKAEEILNFLTKTEFRDKIIIEKKKKISSTKIKVTKEVYKTLFDKTTAPDNSEELMTEFKNLLKGLLDEISNILLVEYNILDTYPGKDTLVKSEELFKDIIAKNNIDSFYDKIYADEEDILELSEDLELVLGFFRGSQKDYYRSAHEIYDNYIQNKNLINSINLDETAEEIENILKMPNPYSRIHLLNNLITNFKDENKKILENEKEPVRNEINEIINSSNYENIHFEQLLLKLDKSNSISEIRLIPIEAKNIKEKLDNARNIVKEDKDDVEGIETVIKVKNLSMVNIMSKTTVDIKSSADIDQFIESLKKNLSKEFEDNDELILNLRG